MLVQTINTYDLLVFSCMIFLRVKVNFDIASILLLLWETCIYFDIAIAMFPLYKKKC